MKNKEKFDDLLMHFITILNFIMYFIIFGFILYCVICLIIGG
jgi:hypothetical protein